MGIKGFSTWLRTKFPVAFTSITKLPCTFDEVYIDLNSYLYKSSTHCSTAPQVLRQLEVKLLSTLRHVRARRRIFISIDGVAPAAKLDVQRSRRANKALESVKTSMFDAQNFTPGCLFMGKVEERLRKIGERIAAKHGPEFEFIISGASVKEEGEIKIARELALQHQNGKRFARAVLTVDSDAFLQAFVHEIPSLFILNAQDIKNGVGCFSGEMMRDEFRRLLPAHNPRQLQLDFALLSIFSGNDCLPGMPYGNITYTWPVFIDYVQQEGAGYVGMVDTATLLIKPEGLVAFSKYVGQSRLDASTKKLLERHIKDRSVPINTASIVDYLKSAQWSFSRLVGIPLAQSLSLFLSPHPPSLFELAEMNLPEVKALFQAGCAEARDNRQDRKKIPGAAAIMMLDPSSDKSPSYIARPLRSLFHAFHEEESQLDDHTRFKKLCQTINELPKEDFTPEELRVTFADLPTVYSRRKHTWKPYDPQPLKANAEDGTQTVSMLPCPMLSALYSKKLQAASAMVIDKI